MPPKRKKAQVADKKESADPAPVFKRKANEVFAELKKAIPAEFDSQLILNGDGKPKRGSFEIFVTKNDGKKVQIWTGLSKGPPRKLKFPDYEEDLKDQFQKIIDE
ncbi:selenoprotein H-like [Chironomus tepperi]|uniref:selenoprotein H-like n=1 Tax=Chironomus tepperi TaxID=113505 RepID=UPI00391F1026